MIQKSNKEAITLALNFFKGNVTLSLAAIAILIGMALLKLVPVVGLVFAFVYPILSFAIQIYVARSVPELHDSEAMTQIAARTKLGDFFTRHLDIAAGGFLGFFLILMVLGLLFMGLLGQSIDLRTLNTGNMEAVAASISASGAMGTVLFFSILGIWMSYLMPGVMGEVMFAEGFNKAFLRSFLFFNPSFWKRTFTKEYFVLILIWSIIVFVSVLLLSWIAVSILLLPIALIGLYFLSLYNAVIYTFAKESLRPKA